MAFYWSIRSVPELARLPRARRRQIWRQSMWSGFASRRCIAVLGISGIAIWIYLAVFGAYGGFVLFLCWPVLLFGASIALRALAINEARPKMAQLANEWRNEGKHDNELQEAPALTDRRKADRWKAVALMLTLLGGGTAIAGLATGLYLRAPVDVIVEGALFAGIIGLLFAIGKCAVEWHDF